MKDKVIIGFIGAKNSGKSSAADVLEKLGFHRLSINSKVKEFATNLLGTDTDDKSIHSLRMKGYGVNNGYWLNLTLMSVPDSVNFMVIEDVYEQDMIKGLVKTYEVIRDKEYLTDRIPDSELILNDTSLDDFQRNVENTFKLIKKRSSK